MEEFSKTTLYKLIVALLAADSGNDHNSKESLKCNLKRSWDVNEQNILRVEAIEFL